MDEQKKDMPIEQGNTNPELMTADEYTAGDEATAVNDVNAEAKKSDKSAEAGGKDVSHASGKKPKKKKKTKGQKAAILIFIFAVVVALSILLYPVASNIYHDHLKSVVITDYDEQVEDYDDTELQEEKMRIAAYNTRIAGVLKEEFTKQYLEEASNGYWDLLNLTGTGLMGYIEIPIIDVYLPVYHEDKNEQSLERGVAHIKGTSLPIGGNNTHAALSAHTGMSGEKMFTDLEELEIGDVFYMHVLGDTLAYEVEAINVVEPYDISLLKVQSGRDLMTLITCTPYAVNTHRLLVTGKRIEYTDAKVVEAQQESSRKVNSNWTSQYMHGVLIGLGYSLAVIAFFVLLFIIVKGVRKRNDKKKAKAKKHS